MFEALAARFEKHIDRRGPLECWPYRSAVGKQRSNSPPFRIGNRQPPASQVALWLTVGPAPLNKPNALHTCDYTPCCNPAHLWWGTTAENVADRHRKGRSAHGERNGTYTHPERRSRGDANSATRIADADVSEIRRLTESGDWKLLPEYTGDYRSGPHSVIGRHYGVSHTAIRNIVVRATKKHIR